MKNINMMKKTFAFLTAIMTVSALTACGNKNTETISDTDSLNEVATQIQTESITEAETSETSETVTESETVEIQTATSSLKAEALAVTSDKTAISDLFSARDLNPEYNATAEITLKGTTAEVKGSGVTVNGSVITITAEGIYHITGKLTDGQIIVNADKAKVQLILDNAEISCSTSSPIYGISSDKIFITLADGSTNTLTDGENYTLDESSDEPDACIFSKDSITVNGSGTLNVNANYNDGIRSKDDIVITGGNININSVGDGIKGKDYVAVADGNITIKSGQDGIKSTNTEDTSLGFVYVEGGNITIDAQQDGIQAETVFTSIGGNFNITAGGGSSNASKTHMDDFGGGMGGGRQNFGGMNGEMPDFGGNGDFGGFGEFSDDTADFGFTNLAFTQTAETSTDTSISTKGIKAGTTIQINDGVFNINSADDTIHSNDTVNISGGNLTLNAGDDGIHADNEINITNGNVNISNSYEGIEAFVINISGGVTELISSDDGFNASDGVTSQGGMGTYTSGVILNISGGTVYVDAGGDGLDSNGDMTISGGTVIVNGPTNSGNGALDSNSSITVTGGLLIAAGSSGMAEHPSDSSTQNSVSCTFDNTYEGGTLVTLLDESGKEILSFAPSKTFQNIIISSPDINSGVTYTFYTGGTSSSENKYGLYSNGGYNNDGTESASFTADSAVSAIGSQGMGGGMNGGMGGHGGRMGGGFGGERPEMPEGGFNGEMPF